MANTLRIKRRVTGGSGAPGSLKNAELAFNEVDNTLYYGKGYDSETGEAEVVVAIAGSGNFVDLTSNQNIGGTKTFTNTITGSVSGNAGTATKLATARDIAVSGDVSGTASFDGSANINISTALASVNSNIGTFGSSSAIPVVTVNGKGLVTAVTTASISTSFNIAGNTGTDTVNGGELLTFTGTSPINTAVTNNTVTISLTNVGTAGTYTKVTTDASGRVTSGASLDANDIPTLTASKISDFDTQVRTSRLDQMAAPTASVSLNSQKITNLAEPTGPQDAATKAYVDASRVGLDVKESVKAATLADVTLSGPQTIDGVSLVAGDRVLVKDQAIASQNGIYIVATGAWTRAIDFSDGNVSSGAFTFVEQGTVHSDSGWVLSTDGTITVGVTSLAFVQFSGAGQITAGAGLTKTGNTIDVGTANSGRIVVNADNIDLATVGTSGTYRSVTTDAYGRVTAGTNPTTLAGYGITDAQPLDATLTALAGLATSADQVIYSTGADTFGLSGLTSFGRSLIDDVDAAAARTTLALGSMATQNANNVAITGGTIDNITIDCGTF